MSPPKTAGPQPSSPRRIFQSTSAAQRLQQAREWVNETRRHIDSHMTLLLANSQHAADEMARQLVDELQAAIGLRKLSLASFAYQTALSKLAQTGRTVQPRLGQEAVIARVLYELGQKEELGPLQPVSRGPGLVRALTASFEECRLHGVDAKRFSRIGKTGEVLQHLYHGYLEICRVEKLADRAEILATATEALRDGTAVVKSALLLDVSVHSTVERDLIRAIAACCEESIFATVAHGDERTAIFLESALDVDRERGVTRESGPESTVSGVRKLQNHLFSNTRPEPSAPSNDVVILSASGETQESVEIVRCIREEASAGTPFDSMAVLLHSPETYTPLLEDAFERAKIPAYFENGTVRPDPSGRAFLALLDALAENYSASRFAEYLSLGQIPREPQDNLESEESTHPAGSAKEDRQTLWVAPNHAFSPAQRDPIEETKQLELFAATESHDEPEKVATIAGSLRAPWRWEKLMVDAAVIGSRQRWERRLAGLSRELSLRLDELDDPDSPEAHRISQRRDDLQHLSNFILPLVERLEELPARTHWGEWLDHLEELAHRVLSRPHGVLALLKDLRPMESVADVELFEVREVLAERLTLLSQEPEGYRYGSVWVAPIDSARGMSFDVVLVPGLAERVFPRKIVEDPLILDAQRRSLDAELPLQEQRVQRERLSLHLAVGAATRKVVFSYPSLDIAKARSRVPSFYLLEVSRASHGRLPDFESLERAAFDNSGARLGWPAPRNSKEAIDDAEYDLSVLADMLKPDTPDDVALGAGRYLVNDNAYLARSLRARYQRGIYGRFTSSDGFLDADRAARQELSKFTLESHPYSVTGLEKYASCPYRFYLNAIMRLRPRDEVEPLTHLDPLTIGSIVHDTQFYVLGRLAAEGLTPLSPSNLDEALRLFESVFRESKSRFYEELAPAIDRIWEDEMARIRVDLRGWLRHSAQKAEEFEPYRREFTFGMRPHGPADETSTLELAVLPNGLRLRGAIDLVEKNAHGQIRITDHKSGKAWVPPGAVLNGGQTLQPILYSLAYEALTGEAVQTAQLYYCTERGGYEQRPVQPDGKALEVVAEFQRRLNEIIAEGFFPAAPHPEKGCRFCDYIAVCGPRAEIDSSRKQRDPRLSPLNWLRNLT